MDITDQENLITRSRIEQDHFKNTPLENNSPFGKRALKYGIIAGLIMGLFMALGGFYITGDQAAIGFAKYLILGAVLYVILQQIKLASPSGETFKYGIVTGMITSAAAAVTMAIITLIVNGPVDAIIIQPYFQQTATAGMSSLVLAGITLFEGLVAGLIFTFIWLQLLKDRSVAK